MDREGYAAGQVMLLSAARVVRLIPLRGMLDQISKAEAIGPIVDPTLYMKAGANLRVVKRLTNALLPFWNEIQKLEKEGCLDVDPEG